MASDFKKWQGLRRGDVVDIIAPGFRPTDAELEAGIKFLESWGLKPNVPKDLFGADTLSSNTDERRFKHLANSLSSRSSSAIWCLRGGYGSIRLVSSLLKLKRTAIVKPVLGLSDVTTLQLFLELKWKWPSLQAPLLDRLGRIVEPSVANGRPIPLANQVKELQDIVFGESTEIQHLGLKQVGNPKLVRGLVTSKARGRTVRGTVTGGNLVTFASAIGTGIHPSTAGKIVYFEDIGERGYRVDRLLVQLVQSGVISNKTKALVFGDFIECSEKNGVSLVPDVITRFAESQALALKIPVFTGLQSGHGENQRVVPLATDALFNLAEGALTISTGVQKPKRNPS